jgi:hypothetical protein
MKDYGLGRAAEGRESGLSRSARSVAGWLAGAVVAGGVILGAYAVQDAQGAQTALGTSPGAVALNPASGPVNSMPQWSTTTGCPAGFQGSAVFRAVRPNGTTFSISMAADKVTAPFSGTLQGPITEIQSVAGVPDGGWQEFVVICFSGDSLTGSSHPDMDTFIAYSANGTYTSSAVAPTTPADPSSPSSADGTGAGSGASGASGTGSGSSSSPGVTPSPSMTLITPDPTSSPSTAQLASPLKSDFAVTG